jgi:hypothetical protein
MPLILAMCTPVCNVRATTDNGKITSSNNQDAQGCQRLQQFKHRLNLTLRLERNTVDNYFSVLKHTWSSMKQPAFQSATDVGLLINRIGTSQTMYH